MVARAPGKAMLAFPLMLFVVAVAVTLSMRDVAAPVQVLSVPVIVLPAATSQPSSAPAAGPGPSSGTASPAQQPRPAANPPSSKVKTGDGAYGASSCTSQRCPR